MWRLGPKRIVKILNLKLELIKLSKERKAIQKSKVIKEGEESRKLNKVNPLLQRNRNAKSLNPQLNYPMLSNQVMYFRWMKIFINTNDKSIQWGECFLGLSSSFKKLTFKEFVNSIINVLFYWFLVPVLLKV